jgi:hypothetical protein
MGANAIFFLQIFDFKKNHQTVHFGLPKYLGRIPNVLHYLKSTKNQTDLFSNKQN